MAANYPPFWPFLYHDIDRDISPQFITFCKANYRAWQILITGGLFIDMLASLTIGLQAPGYLNFFWYKLIYFLIIPPTTFFTVYFSLYKALKTGASFYWAIHVVGNFAWVIFLILSMVGSTETVSSGYGFPGGESGLIMILHYMNNQELVLMFTAIVSRGVMFIALLFYMYQLRKVYVFFRPVLFPAKYGHEMSQVPRGNGAAGRIGGNVNVGGRDVNVSIDQRTAANVGAKAYSSGAAGQLAAGTKVDKNGNVIIDPNAAKAAAGTMHKAGAGAELAAGAAVSSGGYTKEPMATRGQTVKAIHEFKGAEDGDLPLKVGDKVTIIKQVDENWYEGSLRGKSGIFPAKFVSRN